MYFRKEEPSAETRMNGESVSGVQSSLGFFLVGRRSVILTYSRFFLSRNRALNPSRFHHSLFSHGRLERDVCSRGDIDKNPWFISW